MAGAMCALLLCESGYHVRLIESRPDFRIEHGGTESDAAHLGKLTNATKRSINLALSHRGISALHAAHLFDEVRSELIPMNGRVIHQSGGAVVLQPYGHDDQAIYSVSRTALNQRVLDRLQSLPNAELSFNVKCVGVNADGDVLCADRSVLRGCMTVGADGAYSAVRESMRRLQRMDFSMSYITHGYKELTFPPTRDADGRADWPMSDIHGLHIWPRRDFMLIALPNPDRSFTATLFAPFDVLERFDSAADDDIRRFFEENFADALAICPDVEAQWRSSPNSPLLTIRTSPWTYKDRVVIIGDAAHAAVPFYGQGMNAAFEDGLLLTETISKHRGDIKSALTEFNTVRCPAGHALCDLSLDNWTGDAGEDGVRSVSMEKARGVRPALFAGRRLDPALHHGGIHQNAIRRMCTARSAAGSADQCRHGNRRAVDRRRCRFRRLRFIPFATLNKRFVRYQCIASAVSNALSILPSATAAES